MGVVGKRFFGRSFFDRSFFGGSWGNGRSASKLRASAKAVVPLISVFALGACAIAPVQQNVTGLPIVRIVNHIRCESRVAIQKKALDELRKYGWHKYRRYYSALADQLEPHVGEIWPTNIYLPELDKAEIGFYNRYIGTGIAYTFTFDITEDNKASFVADPVKLITNGMVSVNLSASGDFSRENQRSFVVSETFAKLLQNKIYGCAEEPVRPENFAYPIAGSVGIAELISTFIDLNEDENLILATAEVDSASNPASADPSSAKQQPPATGGSSGAPPSPGASPKQASAKASAKGSGAPAVGSGTFSDTLSFMTTLMGGVTPSVQINPVGKQWGLGAGTDLGFTVTRTDHHNLQIGLSLAKPGESITEAAIVPTSPRASVLVTSGRLAPSALQKHSVTKAEQRALDAMTQQRIDNYLTHFRRL